MLDYIASLADYVYSIPVKGSITISYISLDGKVGRTKNLSLSPNACGL